MTGREIRDEDLEEYVQILADVCATGRRLSRDELESLRARGKTPRKPVSDCGLLFGGI